MVSGTFVIVCHAGWRAEGGSCYLHQYDTQGAQLAPITHTVPPGWASIPIAIKEQPCGNPNIAFFI
jgi:hypothetical protein